ncbi:hypothetical protein BKP37_00635 [Anaerobacillus alkalilacustris]|uniref:DNA polymerase III beta sliding clamp C-terminal domain-containing protein n=1 Tax=Anaerobacillus alkalilacustris TaxID=393763 RepID=A0A1S2LXX1_9BACI|nr:hypothetical protein [Anaerobacillus alkalilacustris]OIJ17080.1 hypothetical protein BKP37_00635 [Anaerobacillus alkalilacustris]
MLELVTKHARNFVLTEGGRKELEGIYYDEDGSIGVTDSHVLLYIPKAHNLKEAVIRHHKTGKKIVGKYPNLKYLINLNYSSEIELDMNHLARHIKSLEAAYATIGQIGTLHNDLTYKVLGTPHQSYILTLKGKISSDFNPISLNVFNLYKCLLVFKDLKVDKVYFRLAGSMSPMLITDPDERVKTLISPVRRY